MAETLATVTGRAAAFPVASVKRRLALSEPTGPADGFATSAAADFLETLGWNVAPGARRNSRRHDALACCMILRDGRQEEAAFGFDGILGPQDADHPRLRAACAYVEGVLARLGERRGVLLQNLPLVAAAPGGTGRLAVFGGWRLDAGRWQPFLIAPGGLGAVAAQAALFDAGTRPAHMAEVAGQPASRVLPALGRWVRARATLDPDADAGRATAEGAGQGTGHLRLVPFAGGWSQAMPAAPAPAPVLPMPGTPAKRRRPAGAQAAMAPAYWDPTADEFRFRATGADMP